MKIIRCTTDDGRIVHGVPQGDGTARLLSGPVPGACTVTSQTVRIGRLLAPLVPTAILGVGCNYHRLAAALKAGVNQVNNVEFYTSELRKYRDQARELAMKAAKEKAQADERGHFEVHVSLFVISPRRKNSNRGNEQSQGCALGLMLRKSKQEDQSRHNHHATANSDASGTSASTA